MQSEAPTPQMRHGTCVALTPAAGVFIVGASGRGKSSLALRMMALGATLVADDQVLLTPCSDAQILRGSAPVAIKGLVEARGIGLLKADVFDRCDVTCMVDLDRLEEERLPPRRKERLVGVEIPLYYRVDAPYFASALIQLLKGGRSA